jgi:hypothetical protein
VNVPTQLQLQQLLANAVPAIVGRIEFEVELRLKPNESGHGVLSVEAEQPATEPAAGPGAGTASGPAGPEDQAADRGAGPGPAAGPRLPKRLVGQLVAAVRLARGLEVAERSDEVIEREAREALAGQGRAVTPASIEDLVRRQVRQLLGDRAPDEQLDQVVELLEQLGRSKWGRTTWEASLEQLVEQGRPRPEATLELLKIAAGRGVDLTTKAGRDEIRRSVAVLVGREVPI